jgi:hypothetical protein
VQEVKLLLRNLPSVIKKTQHSGRSSLRNFD